MQYGPKELPIRASTPHMLSECCPHAHVQGTRTHRKEPMTLEGTGVFHRLASFFFTVRELSLSGSREARPGRVEPPPAHSREIIGVSRVPKVTMGPCPSPLPGPQHIITPGCFQLPEDPGKRQRVGSVPWPCGSPGAPQDWYPRTSQALCAARGERGGQNAHGVLQRNIVVVINFSQQMSPWVL